MDGKQAYVQEAQTIVGTSCMRIVVYLVIAHMHPYSINWTGSALNTFYAAVRKALVVVIVLRAIFVLMGLVFGGWFVFIR